MSRLVIELISLERNKAHGFNEYAFNLLNYFYAHRETLRFDEVVIACKNTEEDLFSCYVDKFVIKTFKFKSYLGALYYESILPFVLKLKRTDVIFSPGNYSGLLNKTKEVLVIHDLLFKHAAWLPNKLMRWHHSILVPLSIRKADVIVAISNFTRKEIEQYYPSSKGKIHVIYNAMNFDKYKKYVEPEDKDYFLVISSNAYHKNQQTIFAAYNGYCKNEGKKNMVVVGSLSSESDGGKAFEALPEKIKRRITVKSHISNEEMAGLYKYASCYISASLFEGLGMPIVEAMSYGIPVILSDTEVHREVSLGVGTYFKPENVDELQTKMHSISNERKAYEKEILSFYSDDNTSQRYINILNKLGEEK